MALNPLKCRTALFYSKVVCKLFIPAFILSSCTGKKQEYNSNCNVNVVFKHVGFTHLIDSIENYDQQFVEVSGTYVEGNEQSALFNDSLFVDHSNKHALWINFSQDCPLYLKGTHTGLFEATDGEFTLINNKKITLRGKIDMHNTGHKNQYKGSIDRISYIRM